MGGPQGGDTTGQSSCCSRACCSLDQSEEARCSLPNRLSSKRPAHFSPVLLPALFPLNAPPTCARTAVVVLTVALLPLAAEAQVLDTLATGSDSVDYEVETYFVKVDTASFFKPHDDKKAVRALLNRTGRGRCRVVTVVRAVNQRKANVLAKRYSGGVINMRLIVRCAPLPPTRSSVPTLTLSQGRGGPPESKQRAASLPAWSTRRPSLFSAAIQEAVTVSV